MVSGNQDDFSHQPPQEGCIFGVGNPLLDVCAEVTVDFVQKYDMEPNGAMLGTEKQRTLCQDMVEAYHIDYVPGGSCLNSLRGCQWMLQKSKVTVFSGCIGDDKFGRIMRERAELAGIETNFQISQQYPSGACAVLLTENGRHRSLCAFLNASEHFDTNHLSNEISMAYMDRAKIFYITGFFLTHSLGSALKVAGAGMQPGKMTLFNLSAPYIASVFHQNVMELLPFVDVVFGNDTEFLAFSTACGFETTDLQEIAKKTAALPYNKKEMSTGPGNGDRTVIITNGAEPTIVFHKGMLLSFPVLPVEKVVDTNGAGDAFVGGYLSQLAKGGDVKQCIAGAHYAANVVVQQVGCTFADTPNFTYKNEI